ncbi:MAG: nucleoside triphosphate pyrophosphohydrolase [Bacteroidota bacterium]
MEEKKTYTFDDFLVIVRRLRKECPWDREQTHSSIRHSLLEETYEFIESIDQNNFEEMKKELGDILLHIILHSTMAEETHSFRFEDVVQSIAEKMVRRHPHVFGSGEAKTAKAVTQKWEQIKLREGRSSVMEGVPADMPALLRAQRIQEKASKVGFDWKERREVWKKVNEEIRELMQAQEHGIQKDIEEEFGDLLFSLVNYARFIDINAELSLRSAVEKFIKRFHHVEAELQRQGKTIGSVPLEAMDEIWNLSKGHEM